MTILQEATATVEQSKPAVVMIGRLNPPTAGHYAVIRLLKTFAKKNSMFPVLVIIAGDKTSADKSKNPLTADERVSFIRASGRADGVILLTASNAFQAFENVRKAGYEPTVIAAGSDRAKGYLDLLKRGFPSSAERSVMPGLAEREDPDDEGTPSEEILRLAEDGADIPVYLISGSMARLAVKLGLRKAFAKVVGLKDTLADKLFDKLEKAMKE